jgi:histone chaperone ASF1
VTYIGSAESDQYDQILDDILVGPVSAGIKKFVFQAPPPDVAKLPDGELLGVTAVLLTCSYRGQEFIRVGYYVNNELPGADESPHQPQPQQQPQQQYAASSSSSAAVGATLAAESGAAIVDDDDDGAGVDDDGDDDDMDEDENAVVEGIEEDCTEPVTRKPTGPVNPALVVRNILAAKPRVTRFQIVWDQ